MRNNYFALLMALVLSAIGIQESLGQNTYGFSPYVSTPDVASLGKFAAYPVSNYTGALNLSVPLHRIEAKDNQIDISLRYDASGFIPNKEHGIVGLNWSLVAGGIITRSVNWMPDDQNRSDLAGRFGIPVDKGFIYGQKSNPERYNKEYIRTLSFLSINNQGYATAALKHEYAPDVFSFSFGNHSGTFFMGNEGDVKVNADRAYKVDVSKLSGQYDLCRDLQPSEITVTTDEGDVYVFGGDRNALDITYQYTNTTGRSISCLSGVIMAWRIKKITTRNGRTINFHYETQNNRDWSMVDTHHGIPPSVDYAYTKVYRNEHISLYQGSQGSESINTIGRLDRTLIKTCYLSRIEADNSIVEFKYIQRATRFYGSNIPLLNENKSKFLHEILVSGKSGSAVRRIVFGYLLGGTDGIGYRQFLKSVSFHSPVASPRDHEYVLEYYNTDNNGNFPQPLTKGIDRWGFYNGNNGNGALIPESISSPDYEVDWSFRPVNPQYSNFAMLKSVKNPTGGLTTFEYEPHDYGRLLKKTVAGGMVPELRDQTGLVGGARIAKITESNGVTKSYKYVAGYSPGATDLKSAGLLVDNGVYFLKLIYHYNGPVDEHYAQIQDNNIAASSSYYESPISYSEVTEVVGNTYTRFFYTDPQSNPDKYHLGGDSYRIYPYTDISKTNFYGQIKRLMKHSSTSLERGKLVRQVMYNGNNQPVREIKNIYNIDPDRYSESVMAFNYAYENGLFSLYHSYALYHFNNLVTRREVTDYLNGQPSVTTVTTNTYNNTYRLLKSQITVDSKGTALSTEFKYPFDMGSATVYQGMVSRNIIAPVIEKTEKIGSKQVSFTRNNYYLFNGMYLPRSVEVKTGDNNIETRLTYDFYDVFGNPLQVSRGNSPASYIWSYDYQYPVAEVKNALQNDIAYTGFENKEADGNFTYYGQPLFYSTAPTGKKAYSLRNGDVSRHMWSTDKPYVLTYWAESPDAAGISGGAAAPIATRNGWTLYRRVFEGLASFRLSGTVVIDDVRLYPLGAEMTSYTYDPLSGITSSTDGSDRTTYYEYDGFGRLKYIKDRAGDIVKSYDYKYRNQ